MYQFYCFCGRLSIGQSCEPLWNRLLNLKLEVDVIEVDIARIKDEAHQVGARTDGSLGHNRRVGVDLQEEGDVSSLQTASVLINLIRAKYAESTSAKHPTSHPQS